MGSFKNAYLEDKFDSSFGGNKVTLIGSGMNHSV